MNLRRSRKQKWSSGVHIRRLSRFARMSIPDRDFEVTDVAFRNLIRSYYCFKKTEMHGEINSTLDNGRFHRTSVLKCQKKKKKKNLIFFDEWRHTKELPGHTDTNTLLLKRRLVEIIYFHCNALIKNEIRWSTKVVSSLWKEEKKKKTYFLWGHISCSVRLPEGVGREQITGGWTRFILLGPTGLENLSETLQYPEETHTHTHTAFNKANHSDYGHH